MAFIERILGYWPGIVRAAKAAPDFVRSTTGKIIVAAFIAIIAGSVTYQKGVSRGVAIERSAQIQSRAVEEADRKVRDALATRLNQRRLAAANRRASELSQKVATYEKALRHRGNAGACIFAPLYARPPR